MSPRTIARCLVLERHLDPLDLDDLSAAHHPDLRCCRHPSAASPSGTVTAAAKDSPCTSARASPPGFSGVGPRPKGRSAPGRDCPSGPALAGLYRPGPCRSISLPRQRVHGHGHRLRDVQDEEAAREPRPPCRSDGVATWSPAARPVPPSRRRARETLLTVPSAGLVSAVAATWAEASSAADCAWS